MKRRLLALTAGVALIGSMSAAALAYPSADTMVSVGWNGSTLTYTVTSGEVAAASASGTVSVTPPEDGTVNHGSVVSSLAKAAKGLGFVKGCLMRNAAQADWPATTSSISTACGPASSTADASEDHGPPAHVAEKRQLRATSGWTPGDGAPPWANGDGLDD